MGIESLKNKVYKRGDYNNTKSNYVDIGNYIKKRRKELNITQDEVTEGICSISYLSKIENNQIVPNDILVREIMEKLQVDEFVYTNSLKEKDYVSRLLNAYYYMNDTEINVIFTELKDIKHNYLINLCKLGCTVYNNLEDAYQNVIVLEHLINNMNDLEVGLYLYFSAVFYASRQQYKMALELILLSQELQIYDHKLDGLLFELSYNIKQKLLIINSSAEDYVSALNIFTISNNIKRILRLSFMKVECLIDENPLKAKEVLDTIRISNLEDQDKDLFHYLSALISKELHLYSDATLHLNKIESNSLYYFRKMVLLLEICRIEEDFAMADDIIAILADYKPSKMDIKYKVYYHYLVAKIEVERKEYLRDIAIPFSIKIEDYKNLKRYVDDLVEICIENSRYKEAIQYYKKYEKEIAKVKRIMIEDQR